MPVAATGLASIISQVQHMTKSRRYLGDHNSSRASRMNASTHNSKNNLKPLFHQAIVFYDSMDKQVVLVCVKDALLVDQVRTCDFICSLEGLKLCIFRKECRISLIWSNCYERCLAVFPLCSHLNSFPAHYPHQSYYHVGICQTNPKHISCVIIKEFKIECILHITKHLLSCLIAFHQWCKGLTTVCLKSR